MTAPKSTYRRRRTAGTGNLPTPVVQWFEGLRVPTKTLAAVPLAVRAFPGCYLLSGWWQTWLAEHPGARPPAGYEWLNDPASPRHPTPLMLARARGLIPEPAETL